MPYKLRLNLATLSATRTDIGSEMQLMLRTVQELVVGFTKLFGGHTCDEERVKQHGMPRDNLRDTPHVKLRDKPRFTLCVKQFHAACQAACLGCLS